MNRLTQYPIGSLVKAVNSWNPVQSASEDTFQYIDLGSVGQDNKVIREAKEIRCIDAPSRARQLVQSNDVLVSTVRPNLNGVAKVPECLHGATASTGFCVLRADTGLLDSKYLFQWVKSPHFISEMVKQATGASYPAVSDRIILASHIPLPSLPEQRRIATILDQADALRIKRREAMVQLDKLAQSIFIEMFGHPASNTKKLELIALGDAGKWQSGGTPPRSKEDYFKGTIPWFSSGELEPMYVSESVEHVSEAALRETSVKLVSKGSLMLGMYDTAALKASIAATDCSCNQAVAFAKLNNMVLDSVYAYYAIVIGREHFRRLQRGVRQKNLNLDLIRQIQIPLPPLRLQREFVKKVKRISVIKEVKVQSQNLFNQLFTSVQHRAFRGEL